MIKNKFILVILLFVLSILLSYTLPKAKYVGTGFISQLDIPQTFSDWRGRDVSKEVGLGNINSSTYDFVSEAFAYQYVNSEGKSLLFIILDAGNFHHPKVCFTGAGFKIQELDDAEFHLQDYTLKTHSLFTTKGKSRHLSFYWIVIDKNIAHEWVEQKLKQLLFSLFGKKRVGLMVRVDVPAEESDLEEATILARQFITDLVVAIDQSQAEYIFGGVR